MFLKTLHDYWWAFLIYWLIGVGIYFFLCWLDKKRYGFWSVNPLWEDLCCASTLGLMWPAIGLAVAICWIFIKIEEITGVFINLQCLMGAVAFGYLVFYNLCGLLSGLNLLNIIGLLFFGFLLYRTIGGITVKPTRTNLPSWVEKSVEARNEKFKKAVEEQKNKKEEK